MTTLTTNLPANSGLGLFAQLRAKLRRHAVYVRVYNELSALSDRELEDIGLVRGMLRDVASEASAEA
ncbi:DUF1127 domain-containing protein [Solirhodobacter olei]|uniref:DUF1127 domain-containing protein n=1 Tax=Solirhodobacter olei TaxID=2493082 RepID=UPI001F4DB2CF|nr:DUF1127 domain-containing protein [Solirhodobacter olei]